MIVTMPVMIQPCGRWRALDHETEMAAVQHDIVGLSHFEQLPRHAFDILAMSFKSLEQVFRPVRTRAKVVFQCLGRNCVASRRTVHADRTFEREIGRAIGGAGFGETDLFDGHGIDPRSEEKTGQGKAQSGKRAQRLSALPVYALPLQPQAEPRGFLTHVKPALMVGACTYRDAIAATASASDAVSAITFVGWAMVSQLTMSEATACCYV